MVKSRHHAGILPIDTLTKPSSNNSTIRNDPKTSTNKKDLSTGTRYDSSRYQRTKGLSNFDPLSIADEDVANTSTRNSTSTENIIDITETEENREVLTREKRNEGVGIIGSMDLEGNYKITIPYHTEGTTKIVNRDSSCGEICRLGTGLKITLTKGTGFRQKKPKLSIQFMRKDNKPIEGFCFGLNEGVLQFRYASKGEGFGVIFSAVQNFSLPYENDVRNVRTHCISWTCSSPMAPESKKFLELMKIYEKLQSKSIFAPDNILKVDKREIDEMIDEYTKSAKRLSSPMFSKLDRIQKKDLKSLQKSRKGGSGSRISLPEYPDDPGEKNSGNDAIPQKSFYTASKEQNFTFVSSLSRQTRSATNSNTQGNVHGMSDDLIEQEQPEEFKPTLSYTFPDGFKISVNNQDFKCLYNHDWINDTILDFFLKYYIEESIHNEIVLRSDVYLFSSFFYTKLISTPNNRYDNVKKWVNNSNLFSKTFVVLPVNMNYHWFGCIITNLNKIKDAMERCKELHQHVVIEPDAEDSTIPSDRTSEQTVTTKYYTCTENNLPTISLLVFDSLRQTHSKLMDAVKDFIIDYGKDIYNFSIPREKIKVKTCFVPQQPNMSDCGVHVILNIKKFFERPKETLDLWYTRSSYNHSKMINEFFEKKQRSMARKSLRILLQDLQKQQITANGEANCDTKDDSIEENHSDLEIIEHFDENSRNDKQGGTTETEENGSQRDTGETRKNADKLPDLLPSSTTLEPKRSTSEAEQSSYFEKNSDLTALADFNDENLSDDATASIGSQSQNKISKFNRHNNKLSKNVQEPISVTQLSDRDYSERSEATDDFISSQPPDTHQIKIRRATEELDDVDDDSSIDDEISRRDSTLELNAYEKLSPLPDLVLKERFQRLRTSEHKNETIPSTRHETDKTNSKYFSVEIPSATRGNDNISNDSYLNHGTYHTRKQSPEVLNEKISLELKRVVTEEVRVPPDWDQNTTHTKPSGDLTSDDTNSNPIDTIGEILTIEPKKENEEQPRNRVNKRSFEHTYENGKNIYAGSNPKILKPNNVFDKSASK